MEGEEVSRKVFITHCAGTYGIYIFDLSPCCLREEQGPALTVSPLFPH